MKNVKLSNCGNYIAQKTKADDYLICLNRILTVGTYTDMNGSPVEVTEETLVQLVDNYNTQLAYNFDKHQRSIEEAKDIVDPAVIADNANTTIDNFDGLTNQTDHDVKTVHATVGCVIGKMFLRKSLDKLSIFCNLKIKGHENVCCVVDGRWRNLSVQYNPTDHSWTEVSWVVYGADPDANKIMSAIVSDKKQFTSEKKQNTSHITNSYDTMEQCLNVITALRREIFLDKKLIRMCKSRKITKADSYFMKKELSGIKDLSTLSVFLNILDDMVPLPSKSPFIQLSREHAEELTKTLNAGANYDIYKR